jgi:hypothetical protein
MPSAAAASTIWRSAAATRDTLMSLLKSLMPSTSNTASGRRVVNMMRNRASALTAISPGCPSLTTVKRWGG